MKVGVVGCGKIAIAVHLPSLHKIKGYELVAAADVNETRLQEVKDKYGVNETYDDYRRMLVKADIDTVFVCTPPEYHFQIVMDALEWGKHVFCEKPLATTLDEGLAIKKVLSMKQKTMPEPLYLMPAHNFIFTPCFSEALKLIESGKIGKIQKINCCSVTNLQFYGAKTDFRTQAKCGVIEDLLPHLIYLVHEVGGPLEKVACVEPHLKGGVVGDVTVNVMLANAVEANLKAQWTGLVPTLRLDLFGERGEIRMDLLRTPYNITIVKDGATKAIYMGRRLLQYVDVFRSKHPSYTNEHIHFLNCVENEAEPKVTVDHGIQLVRTLSEVTECFKGKAYTSMPEAETVVILRAGDNIEATVQRSIDMLGGLTDIKKDDFVVIKPNVCYPKNLENMVITDLRVLEPVLNMVKQRTKNVLVVESDSHSGTAEKRLIGTGVMDVIKKCDAEFFNLSRDDVEEHRIADVTIPIPKTVLRADYFINLPKVKTNTFVLISVAMKNMFGVIASKHREQFHKRLADVLVYLNQAVKQDLVIVDGIVAMEGLGPIRGSPVNLGLIIAGKNPVTVDAACCHIMGFKPYAAEALWKAHQQGMGEIDAQKIRFLGEDVNNVKNKFAHPTYSRENIVQALKTTFKAYTKR
jgi:predicted dehydrogenase